MPTERSGTHGLIMPMNCYDIIHIGVNIGWIYRPKEQNHWNSKSRADMANP